MADYKKKIGFKGTLLLEPKPHGPLYHLYAFDASTTLEFLRRHGLENEFKLNIECNHATLAGHTCEHEVRVAAEAGMLGGVDSNSGEPERVCSSSRIHNYVQ